MILLRLLLIVWLATSSHGYNEHCQDDCNEIGTYKCGNGNSCICNVGFYGVECEMQQAKCSHDQCNGGKCVFIFGNFECACPEGKWGRVCEHTDAEVQILTKKDPELATKYCKKGDEECEPPHLKVVCSHENLDYCDEKGNVRPFKKCPYPWYCFEAFRNGKCDWECERPECLFDGYECATNRKCNENCILPSGACDLECSVQYQANEHPNAAAGTTVLEFSLNVTEEFWWKHQREIIANISEPLRTPLMYVPELNPVLETNKNSLERNKNSLENILSRGKRRVQNERGRLVNVSLQMMAEHCSNRAVCTDNGVAAGEHLSYAASVVKADARFDIITWMRVNTQVEGGFSGTLLVCLIIIAVPIVIVGYRVVSAPVWFPPAEEDEEAVVLPVQDLPLDPLTPTPLHEQALYQSRISLPIRQEDVNRKDEMGRTPLFWLIASEKNSQLMLEDVNELVRAGANPNISDNAGATPLSIAIRALRPSVCDRLVQWGADPAAVTHSGASCLHLAVAQDDVHCVQWLLGFPSVRNNINDVDESDRTPLAMAAQGGMASAHIARILISAGADIDHQGNQSTMWRFRGRSALHWAALMNNLDVMQVLLGHRCDVNCVDVEGCTPLHLAVQRCSEAAVRMLLEAHANTRIANGRGEIPLSIAKEKGMQQLVDWLAWYEDVTKEELVIKKRAKKRRRVEKETHHETKKKHESSMGSPDVVSLDSNCFVNGTISVSGESNSEGYISSEYSNYGSGMDSQWFDPHVELSVITPPPSVEEQPAHAEENQPDPLATLALLCDLSY